MDDLIEYAFAEFPTLSESAAPCDAMRLFGESRLAVIVDGAQLPVGLVTPRDVERAAELGDKDAQQMYEQLSGQNG